MTARTSNLNPHIPIRQRGGFSLFQGGMGDLVTDPSQMMTGPFVSLANPELNVDSSSGTNSTWLIAIGAIAALYLFDDLVISKR